MPAKSAGELVSEAKKNIQNLSPQEVQQELKDNKATLIDIREKEELDHTDRGDKVGRDSLKAMIQYVRTNFSDMKMETIKEMADGDHVFQWMRYTGSSDGTKGMPAGPYDMRAIEVTRFQNGKAVEHWAYMDMAEMMKMMGQQSHTQPAGSPADTTSKAPAQ